MPNKITPEREKLIELEQNKHEIIEMAGKRSFEESRRLLEASLESMRIERVRGEGRISRAKTIEEINTRRREGLEWKKVVEGAVTYMKVEDDAKIIDTSDAHGSFEDVKPAISEFLERRAKGENVYFNFGGDIGSGKPEKIELNEAFAALKRLDLEHVTREAGNGDRRGLSLFHGLATEITERFVPDLFKRLDEETKKVLARLVEENKIPDIKEKAQKRGWEYNIVFGAKLLQAARRAGSAALKPEEISPEYLYKIAKGAVGLKSKEHSEVLTFSALRPLREALESPEKVMKKGPLLKERLGFIQEKLNKQAKEIFEYWKLQNDVYSEQPTHAIYESKDTIAICTHSGYADDAEKLGDLVHDPVRQGKAVWNTYIKKKEDEGKVAKYGDFITYYPEDYGKFLGKFVSREKNILAVVGHNHGNFTERIPLLDKDGRSLDKEVLRVEVCSGSAKIKEPKYAIIDLKKTSENPKELEKAVEYKEI